MPTQQCPKVAVIPGDGIGPEITRATLRILETAGFKPEWVYLDSLERNPAEQETLLLEPTVIEA